jgi:indolepyruvate ferredoxin oxidoreductase alpha subunit
MSPEGTRLSGTRAYSVRGVTRFVVDCETLLRIAAGEIEVAAEHKLVAPTLVRSQALSALYEAARRDEISAAEGIERVTRINSLKVRFLGDKVLKRTARRVADHLGWETTFDAEIRGADAAAGGRLHHVRQRAGAGGLRHRRDRDERRAAHGLTAGVGASGHAWASVRE